MVQLSQQYLLIDLHLSYMQELMAMTTGTYILIKYIKLLLYYI
jgi:hypothetical protein